MRSGSRYYAASYKSTCFLISLICCTCLATTTTAKDTPYLPQSFTFSWTPPGQSPPIPTTVQCDTLHITWRRQGSEPGPNPVAPYFLHVFTSTFIVPFVIPAESGLTYDWPVPFIPGTQYQVCMFDSANNTGGCQDIYTVYPAANSTVNDPPACRNLSYPHPNQVLGVTASTSPGGFSQFGWIDQCTDISVQPINGTPPYTLTIAPTLRPPYVITSDTMDPINWTVSLSWGSSFFISLTDSSGMLWAQGPLHSGLGTSTACLDTDGQVPLLMSLSTTTDRELNRSETLDIKPWVAAASSVGSILLGILVGLLGAFFFMRCQARRAQCKGQALREEQSTGKEHSEPLPQGPLGRGVLDQNEPSVVVLGSELGGSTVESVGYITTSKNQIASDTTTRVAAKAEGVHVSSDSVEVAPRRSLSHRMRIAPADQYGAYPDSQVINIGPAQELDLPPRYKSPLDSSFSFGASPRSMRKVRPLPTPPVQALNDGDRE
ncbi:uncharacterized protein PHACADRAFT_213500 [Phanerochaete carnosa HHB-10118-sp]|uniref:Fibronectin type-III domain-containing protein n=1 Tax=Phanerochaete carnosa (strain HHB-10118-sp) TaxID=650164 RepID=K5VVJ1_PHACS|nr:uncharacterized protein PHACADRAFT_213500 [Phanerochaete carnosa HHB-10118-sp]EKM50599.1 hypothetical protein PHACADRAFT_213500 [Phanerochaete carnosa HHB-10118-sp]